MTNLIRRARRVALGVPEKKISGFKRGDSANWRHLETAVRADIAGYHAAIEGGNLDDIMARIEQIPGSLKGYAHEGVAMGLTGLDCVLPWKSRFREYLAGPGDAHVYMAHIGAGQALALMRRRPEPFLARLDDHVVRWLVMDGYGFHLGFFARAKYVERQRVPEFLSPFARRIFDQGVGRSFWFSEGADIDQIAAQIAAFTPHRHADLWLGIGLACCYVGGLPRRRIEHLREVCAPHLPYVAMGAAFAAHGRHRAGNPQPDTDLACEVLCETDSLGAWKIVADAFASVPPHPDRPGYELLLNYVSEAFSAWPAPVEEEAHG